MGTTNVLLDDNAQEIVQKAYKLGGGGLYTYYVFAEDTDSSGYAFTFQCDTPGLDSYNKLAQYLLSKGYYYHQLDDGYNYYPLLSVVSFGGGGGLSVDNTSLPDGQLGIKLSTLCISSGSLSSNNITLLPSDNFNIILVTE